jgi:Tfp pilus assembly protein PilP
MKVTATISVCVLAAGLAAAQSPISVIQNTRTTMNGVRDNSAAASNAALGISDKAPSAASAQPKSSAGPVSAAPVSVGTSKLATSKTSAVKPARRVAGAKSAQPKAAAVAPSKNATAPAAGSAPASEVADKAKADDQAASENKWSGKRDPFISPVVSHANSSSCSSGKKCLEIGTINLRGIVHSEQGFIAVVSNGLNKAYFLRENDPVFNGYVMKITGDSIVFQETLQDRLGKTFTREVVKKITTPAV